MKPRQRGAAWLHALVLALASCAGPPFAPPPERDRSGLPTVEWIHGAEREALDRVPAFQWLEDGSLLLYDAGAAPEDPALECFDPDSGRRSRWLALNPVHAELRALLGEDAPAPGWPEALEGSGRWALYVLSGDLFVVDCWSGSLRRLTDTPEEEKCARFSPDGLLVSFVRQNDLFVHDLDAGVERRLTEDGSETTLNGTLSWLYWEEIQGRRDEGTFWSGDSRSLAFLQTDESGVPVSHFVDFRPFTPTVHTQRYPRAGSPNPRVRVGVVRLADGAVTFLPLESVDAEYVLRVQWLPDHRHLAVQTMNRAQTDVEVTLFDAAGGPARSLLHEHDPAWVNLHDDLYFFRDGTGFLWESERTGFAHLYRHAMDGTLLDAVTAGDWAVHASAGAFWVRRAIASVDEAAGQVYFTSLQKSPLERHLYRVSLAGGTPERISLRDGTHQVTFRQDGRYYVNAFSSHTSLPELSVHRSDGTRVAVLSRERRLPFEPVVPELFTIPARDGFAMPAEVVRPPGFSPTRRYPLILYVYGGPSAPTVADAWRGSSLYFDQILARRGYLVARVDNRSATAVSKRLENRILDCMYGDSELDDLLDAVRWWKSQPCVDPDRVGIWGWSGGGTFTLQALTRSREFRAGIAVAAVTDWRYYDSKWAEGPMKLPSENPEGYAHFDLNARAKDLHGRLLLVHGTYDDNVHPANAWAFVDALVAAGKPFDLMMYPMRKHGISDTSARIHLYRTMLEFWERWLPAGREE